MFVWIFAALLVAAAWIGGYFLGIALWIKIALTALAIAMIAGVFLFRAWRAKRAARALEAELMKQAEVQAANARPDRRAEVQELQAQFKKGLGALKASKLGGAGNALYALPWYMIVGPPGAGKTTALRHSGLVFPFAGAGESASLRGVGGTRNCDWWFTNEAILLDTAGRFATHEEDREEWSAFLDMLRRHRAEKPINGVLVAISVAEVAAATEEQLEATAKTLRARIDEVMTRLQMIVPVYVVFTKVDLVAGFVEFFEDMKKSERSQLWGMTFSLGGSQAEEPGKAFEREFDVLVESLHGQAIRRVAATRQIEKRARVLQFPVEMRALKASLGEFVGVLLGKNAFQETPVFRGVYFTSGTQEGRPLDRVMAGMARAFGLRAPVVAESTGPAADAKSYFLTDLFAKVIFPDQHVAGRTLAEARRRLLARVAFGVGALALASLVAIPAGLSYGKNRELVVTTAQAAEAAAKFDAPDLSPEARLERIEPLRKRIAELAASHEQGAKLGYRWGMYVGEELRGPAEAEYAAVVGRSLDRTVKVSLEQRLRSIEASNNRSSEDFNRHYDNLKKYLMLTAGPEKLDPSWSEWAAPRVAQNWAELLGVTNAEGKALLLENVKEYFRIAGPHPLARDAQLVGRARSELLRAPQMGALYETLVRDTNTEIAPIRRETIFYGSIAPFVTAKRGLKVDGAYTKLGWAKIRRLLDAERSKLTSEGWVLGSEKRMSEEEVARQVQLLRQIYFERYRESWRDFIADLEVSQPKNAEGALDQLLALSEPEWPYLRLIRILDENVVLELSEADVGRSSSLVQVATDVAKAKLLGQSIDAGGALLDRERVQSPMELAFRPMTVFGVPPQGKPDPAAQPTGLSQYQAIVRKLVGVLTDLKDAKAAPDPKAVTGEFESAFRATSALLADQDAFTRPLLTPLLLNPITLAWASVLRDAGGAVGGLWEVSVWRAWSAKLEGKYPFNEAAPNDAKLEDFAEFFRPQTGLLWGFYEQSLKGSLERQGTEFSPIRRFKSQVAYSEPFLGCLKRGAKVTEGSFGADGKTPSVSFEVNLHSVSPDVAEVSLEIDGVSHTYTNTPEQWVAVTWPAKEAKARGARVRVRGLSGLNEEIVRAGDFGFFRLLDAAEVKPGVAGGSGKGGDAPVLVATWKIRSQAGSLVKIDIRPSRTEAPFTRGFFSGLRCPRVVTSGER